MIDFERFWGDGHRPDLEDDDAADAAALPGVTAEEIREWERRNGVTLPEPIRSALGRRNGGPVRNTSIVVLPLAEIVPVDDDFWEYTELDDEDAPDHRLVFHFGDENESGATLLLNFNEGGPGGPPSVYLDHHGESTYRVGDEIGAFFEEQLASVAEPHVDWSEVETGTGLTIIARETIDLSAMHDGEPAAEEQVLARRGEALVLFTRERSPEGEALTRTTLPLPLDRDGAEIGPYRPAPIGTFSLQIQPEESEGIIEERSETNEDGRWKNSTSHGVPIYVTFESTDRDRLAALRTQLLGAEGAARAQAREDRQAELEATLETLTPEQRSATFLQAALNLRDEAGRASAAGTRDLGPMPPELAEAAAAMRRKLEEVAERIRRQAAANPPDPEILRRVEGLLRDPDEE